MLKCVVCGGEADVVFDGNSLCVLHARDAAKKVDDTIKRLRSNRDSHPA